MGLLPLEEASQPLPGQAPIPPDPSLEPAMAAQAALLLPAGHRALCAIFVGEAHAMLQAHGILAGHRQVCYVHPNASTVEAPE